LHRSQTRTGTEAGVRGLDLRRKLSFSFGQYTTVFLEGVCTIKACILENINRNYNNRNIYILPDRQTTIKALTLSRLTQN